MRSFQNVAAQGDMMLIRIDELPSNVVPVKSENGRFILTHSETSHHHVVKERPDVRMFNDAMDIFRSFLVVENTPVMLEHLRATDTHEPLEIKPGVYEVRRQREYSPAGWQRAAD